jgi:SAM-dependent methyltransferase
MSSSLYQRTDLYDLVSPADPMMTRFYVDVAREGGGEVLELACGTGRFTVPLAEAGLAVVGADISGDMLEAAQDAAARAGVAIEWVELDMRNFDLERTFQTIIVAANSILHLHTGDDFAGFFAAVRRHLAPGGRLVFDAFVPSIRLLSFDPDSRELLGTFAHPALGEVTIDETIRYDPISQVSQADWYWSTVANPDFRHTTLHMRQIFPQELPLLLVSVGFRLIERFGDFDRSPLTNHSWRQVCICGVSG